MGTSRALFVEGLLSVALACRGGGAGTTSTSTPTPTATPTPTSTSTATATPAAAVTVALTLSSDAGAGSCHADVDCSPGLKCFFREEGCATAGKCLASDGPRNCNVAIAMCSCARHETFFGSGGCAGSGVREPWELYACPCVTDAECRGGQRCVPKQVGFSRPDTARECRDPKP